MIVSINFFFGVICGVLTLDYFVKLLICLTEVKGLVNLAMFDNNIAYEKTKN